jgi:hypothetical protein
MSLERNDKHVGSCVCVCEVLLRMRVRRDIERKGAELCSENVHEDEEKRPQID